jgi:hypothetical protein
MYKYLAWPCLVFVEYCPWIEKTGGLVAESDAVVAMRRRRRAQRKRKTVAVAGGGFAQGR